MLLATFSDALAAALRTRLKRLIGNEPKLAERLEVHSMSGIGRRLYAANVGRLDLAREEDIRELLRQVAAGIEGHRFGAHFLWTEWNTVVDAWQLGSWEDYRDVQRLGRKTRLAEKQRELLWSIFSRVQSALAEQGRLTEPGMFVRLAVRISEAAHPPFGFCVIDEAQDVGVAELRFLAALGGGRPNGLFFAGDLGQRIFQTPFSWRSLGVDVRGRSHTLRINYRTSHQIRRQADRLLPPELADVDGNAERRGATVSVFNGPAPEVRTFESPEDETEAIADWLRGRQLEGYAPHAIGVFVRSLEQIERSRLYRRRACDPCSSTTGPAAYPDRSRSARCTSPRGWSSGRSRWPRATTRSFLCRRGSNGSEMTPIWRRSTAPNVICSTSPAPARATGYW